MIGKYSKACKAGDIEKAEKISKELDEKRDKMSDEQKEHLAEAKAECFLNILEAKRIKTNIRYSLFKRVTKK